MCPRVPALPRAAMVPPVLQTFIEASTDALFATGPDGHVTAWSHGAQLTYGYLTDEAVGHAVHLAKGESSTGLLQTERRPWLGSALTFHLWGDNTS